MGILFKEVSHYYATNKKKEHTVAFENVNIDINRTGEFVSLVGKTGSGKSTLIQHINGLILPSKGTVDVMGHIITPNKKKNPKMKEIRKQVGFVFQFPEYQLFEETVLKDIMFAPKNFGQSVDEAKESAIEAARILKIDSDILDKSPFNLSGGQMRKVSIAGILAYNPDVLLLDEPTRGLDPKTADEIMDLFYEIHTKYNKTIVLISHDMNIVYKYSTRIIVMNDGEITYDGNKVDLFKSNRYKENHLTKPDVLEMIDYLNDKMNYNLDYHIYDENQLLDKVVKLHE